MSAKTRQRLAIAALVLIGLGVVAWDAWQAHRELAGRSERFDALVEGAMPKSQGVAPVPWDREEPEGLVLRLGTEAAAEPGGPRVTIRMGAEQRWTLPYPPDDEESVEYAAWFEQRAEPVYDRIEEALRLRLAQDGAEHATLLMPSGGLQPPEGVVIRLLSVLMEVGVEKVALGRDLAPPAR